MKPVNFACLYLALGGALLLPALGHAEVSCTRGGLQQAVDLYVAAQGKGDLSGLPLAKGVGYWENTAAADMQKGMISKAMKIDHQRSFLDTDTCQTITEVIVTDKAAPYVLSTRLRVNHDKIVEIEILWTTTGYWLFNADSYLKYSAAENWGPIPAPMRTSRGTLASTSPIGVSSSMRCSERFRCTARSGRAGQTAAVARPTAICSGSRTASCAMYTP
jgi:hypothetical protein